MRAAFATVAVLAASIAMLASCTDRLSLDDRTCPCTDGFVCCAATNKCARAHEVCPSSVVEPSVPPVQPLPPSAVLQALPAKLLLAGNFIPDWVMNDRLYYTDVADHALKVIRAGSTAQPETLFAEPGVFVVTAPTGDTLLAEQFLPNGNRVFFSSDTTGPVTLPQTFLFVTQPAVQLQRRGDGYRMLGIEVGGRLVRVDFRNEKAPQVTTTPILSNLVVSGTCANPQVRLFDDGTAVVSYCKAGATAFTFAKLGADDSVHELGTGSSFVVAGSAIAYLDENAALQLVDRATLAKRAVATDVTSFKGTRGAVVYISHGHIYAADVATGASRTLSNDARLVRIDATSSQYVVVHDDRGAMRYARLDGTSVGATFWDYGSINSHGASVKWVDPFDLGELNGLYYDEDWVLTLRALPADQHTPFPISTKADVAYGFGGNRIYFEEPAGVDPNSDDNPLANDVPYSFKDIWLFDEATHVRTLVASAVRPFFGVDERTDSPPIFYAGHGKMGDGIYSAQP